MNAVVVGLLLYAALLAPAPVQSPTRDILAVIERSAEDWNRGDIEAYAQCYEQSPETTFVGTEVSRGVGEVVGRYRRAYPDAAHMGKLTFSNLEVRVLGDDLAIVTGRFDLTREARVGGNKAGLFTVVTRKGPSGWRIIHDHTSSL